MRTHAVVADGLDPAPLMAAIDAQPGIWRAITQRQEYPGTAHADTETIFLRGPIPGCSDVFNDIRCVDYGVFLDMLAPRVHALLRRLLDSVDGYDEIGRAMIVKLKSGGHIMPHVDEGRYADFYDRFHLVMRGACRFRVADAVFSYPPGVVFWFNHKLEHEVWNSGEDRVHLILDVVAPAYRGLRF
jgi:hypothetical protein